jgi:hypothetical protein
MERRWAHTVVTVFMLTLLTAGGCSQTVRENSNKSSDAVSMDISWQKYKGAWFTIQYPPNFSVSPSLPAEQSGEYDSVFFVAPDNNISFMCSHHSGDVELRTLYCSLLLRSLKR